MYLYKKGREKIIVDVKKDTPRVLLQNGRKCLKLSINKKSAGAIKIIAKKFFSCNFFGRISNKIERLSYAIN